MGSRRLFIQTGLLAVPAVSAVLGACSSRSVAGRPVDDAMRATRPGLQLYTVRSLMASSVETTLDLVAATGYKDVEFAGYFDQSASGLRTLLDDLGLTAGASHLSLDRLRTHSDTEIEFALSLGCNYIVVPFLGSNERKTIEDYRQRAGEFNAIARKCQAAGIGFAYHNHAFEFDKIDDMIPFDILVRETDRDLVAFELDLFWINKGGYDPLDYFNRYPGRFHLCHVKDMTTDGEMTEVGQGTLPFSAYFGQIEEAGIRHFFVEHDNPADPEKSIRKSYEGISGLLS